MGNTFFYQKVREDRQSITWKEIFSESFKKHSKAELEHVLAAGTIHNRATESDMLAKWDKPWVWFLELKIGVLISLIIYLVLFVIISVCGETIGAIQLMTTILPTFVIPVTVMIFLWELNIPKNISIYECFAWWIIGGMLSIGLSVLMISIPAVAEFTQSIGNAAAPLTEEPGKLIIAVAILAYAGKKRKIYGMTGLVIGACVGAGFSAFESMQYAYHALAEFSSNTAMIATQIMRALMEVNGHSIYCAPYAAAVALHMKDSKFTYKCFFSVEFLVTFVVSVLMHALRNCAFSFATMILFTVIATVCLWSSLLWMVNKCLKQVVKAGNYSHTAYVEAHSNIGNSEDYDARQENRVINEGDESGNIRQNGSEYAPPDTAAELYLVCMGGRLDGAVWKADAPMALYIGRSADNDVRLPDTAKGVSRKHCRIYYESGCWNVTDLNSTYGTFVNGHRVDPKMGFALMSEDEIQLAGSHNKFKVVIK